MRVVVIGGTVFIGRSLVDQLHAAGHEVLVVHRGQHEPDDLAPVEHLHVDRAALGEARDELAKFRPDVLIDNMAMTRTAAQIVVDAVDPGVRLVVTSSIDVYRAYGALMAGTLTDAVPFDETAPVRAERYPYKDVMPEYEKLDVEEVFLARGGTVCRLPMVYGEHDGQRREEPILRRVRAKRDRIPVGCGTWLPGRGYVHDIARGLMLVAEHDDVGGEIFNLGEERATPMGLLAAQILAAAGAEHIELVRVPDDALPEDLDILGFVGQHLNADASKARRVLGYTDTDPDEALRRTVAWHLANPPDEEDTDFSADDAALDRAIVPDPAG
jgi:nucleoside-diphosphate-sugar epimerase